MSGQDFKNIAARCLVCHGTREFRCGPCPECSMPWLKKAGPNQPMSRQDLVERLTAERDGWMRIVGEIAATVPLPYVIKATGTTGDLIAHFKAQATELSTLRSRCAELEAERDELLDKFDSRVSMHHDAEAARDEAVRALERHKIALNVAVDRLSHYEPGDSRAVSDLFVALAAIACGVNNRDDWAIIDAARAAQPSGKEKGDG